MKAHPSRAGRAPDDPAGGRGGTAESAGIIVGTGGHWVCDAGGTEWINGLIPSSDTGSSGGTPDLPGTGSFHPTAAGQAAYAQLVDGRVTG